MNNVPLECPCLERNNRVQHYRVDHSAKVPGGSNKRKNSFKITFFILANFKDISLSLESVCLLDNFHKSFCKTCTFLCPLGFPRD